MRSVYIKQRTRDKHGTRYGITGVLEYQPEKKKRAQPVAKWVANYIVQDAVPKFKLLRTGTSTGGEAGGDAAKLCVLLDLLAWPPQTHERNFLFSCFDFFRFFVPLPFSVLSFVEFETSLLLPCFLACFDCLATPLF